LAIRQPKVKEIAMLGEANYFLALSIFKMTKEQLRIESPEVTNWTVFNQSLEQKIDGVTDLRALLTNFLQLFFLSTIIIGPRSLILQAPEGLINVEPEKFHFLQEAIGEVGGASLLTPAEEQFKPKNKRAAEIAEKMKKARKRLAAQKPQAKTQGFLTKYIRAVATVTANSLDEVNSMTLLQLNALMQAYLAWESYDLEVKSRLAGAKNDDKLEHWVTKSHEKENESIVTI
jgi:hypothetical protein